MARPTIRDLAAAANVSVATVNRVLGGSQHVKSATMQRVREAAAEIGFYGLGAIESRVAAARTRYKFGFILQQSSRAFYRHLAEVLRDATERVADAQVEVRIEFIDDLSPQNIANSMLELARTSDAIGVVAAVHPIVMQAIETLEAQDIPVFALISQLASTGRVHFVGCDGWKTGRTAAWVFHHVCREQGKLGILVGNPRYRCQEMNESGFRSYFREHANNFSLLEPLLTFESAAVAQEMTERLLRDNPDLRGLYVAGGGISGAVAALRSTGMAGKIALVGHDIFDVTREALLDGTMTVTIAHPLPRLADTVLAGMMSAVDNRAEVGNYTTVLPFDLYTRENL